MKAQEKHLTDEITETSDASRFESERSELLTECEELMTSAFGTPDLASVLHAGSEMLELSSKVIDFSSELILAGEGIVGLSKRLRKGGADGKDVVARELLQLGHNLGDLTSQSNNIARSLLEVARKLTGIE